MKNYFVPLAQWKRATLRKWRPKVRILHGTMIRPLDHKDSVAFSMPFCLPSLDGLKWIGSHKEVDKMKEKDF